MNELFNNTVLTETNLVNLNMYSTIYNNSIYDTVFDLTSGVHMCMCVYVCVCMYVFLIVEQIM